MAKHTSNGLATQRSATSGRANHVPREHAALDESPAEAFIPEILRSDLRKVEIAPSDQSLDDRIRQRAYELAAHRGFVPGHELEDWLQAEKELLNSAVQAP